MAQYDLEPRALELLTPEQRGARLRELEEWGVDLSLIRTALARTPTERLRYLEGMVASIQQMQDAWQKQFGQPRGTKRRSPVAVAHHS